MIVNIDTLEISFNVINYEIMVKKYLEELEERKNERSAKLHSGNDDKSFMVIGEQSFEVKHAGKHGYAYILHNDDMELNIARFRSKIPDFYPIRVRFKAKLLWEQGRLAYSYIARFIRDSFGYFDTNKVGRVDFACHTDQIEPTIRDWDDFVGRFKSDQAIRYNRVLETLYFGSRKTQKCYCRIYNKTKKCLRDKENQWFFDIWHENGMDLMKVWNIEFEMHRAMLKEMDVETYEDLNEKINSIWIYLTGSWLTWRIPGSASRRTRMDLNPAWIEIQTAYMDFEFKGFIERYRQRLKDTTKYIPAISGYITSLSALINVDDIDKSLAYIKGSVEDYIKGKKASTFKTLVEEKKSDLVERGVENLDVIVQMTTPCEINPKKWLDDDYRDEKRKLRWYLKRFGKDDNVTKRQQKVVDDLKLKLDSMM